MCSYRPSLLAVAFCRLLLQLVTLPMGDVIPSTLRSTLERVCRKFFNREAAHKSPKHQRFVELYQRAFERDFQVPHEAVREPGRGVSKGTSFFGLRRKGTREAQKAHSELEASSPVDREAGALIWS